MCCLFSLTFNFSFADTILISVITMANAKILVLNPQGKHEVDIVNVLLNLLLWAGKNRQWFSLHPVHIVSNIFII